MEDSTLLGLIERAVEIDKHLSQVKPLYKEREDIMAKLIAHTTDICIDTSSYTVTMCDNYASKNVVWKACGISRYELEIIHKS